ncbi:hypothetical protein H5410_034778 [Solanum commersonii]|uniref:Uncharacterized protein n=1 Tax=Solanum commersonii TaxID=4109 RepID=A0A9J5YUG2_SOLCO|nr:hypothetical protein H5410_034778 [Solanum commersonii]
MKSSALASIMSSAPIASKTWSGSSSSSSCSSRSWRLFAEAYWLMVPDEAEAEARASSDFRSFAEAYWLMVSN